MTLKELKSIGRELGVFLAMFASCFASFVGRRLLKIYVQGQLSDIKNKNCEAIALKFDQTPRTLQRFLESIKWNEEQVRDRCQQIVARDHAHQEAIGTVDESGIAKSGSCTEAVGRQYNGNRGENSDSHLSQGTQTAIFRRGRAAGGRGREMGVRGGRRAEAAGNRVLADATGVPTGLRTRCARRP